MKTISVNAGSLRMVTPESDSDIQDLTPLIVPAYKQVFGDDVWREGWKCTVCKRNYAFTDPRCSEKLCCKQKLVEFYSDQDVVEMLQALLVKRYQLRALLAPTNKVVGFQWGWVDSLENMNVKLGLFPEILAGLRRELETRDLYERQMYYWSESGVLSEYRRQGLAKVMYTDISLALAPKVRKKLLRTTPESPQYQFSRSQGDQVVFNYTDNTRDRRMYDDRVLLAGIL